MKKINKCFKYILILLIMFMITGCDFLKKDDMEDITIITTIYPLEYTINYLYGNNSIINSIYPDGTNVNNYTFTNKQINDFSKKDLFVYLGNTGDTNEAVTLLNKNKNIKLIDSSFGMQFINSEEELWLNPSNLLMMSQNIKNGLEEYINSSFLLKDIDENYENLKLELSLLDADIKLTIENAPKKTIFTNNKALKYLEKYGLTVYVLDESDDIYERNLNILNNYIENGKVKNIYILENTDTSQEIDNLIIDKKISEITFRDLKNITDGDRNANRSYIDLTKENIENLKKELY